MAAVKQAFSQEFQVKDMGELHYSLRMKVVKGQCLYWTNIILREYFKKFWHGELKKQFAL